MAQIRIGDAERDAAAAALGDHYAAGRLTKAEYDERIDQIWAARFNADLAPVFADLPRQAAGIDRPARTAPAPRNPQPVRWAAQLRGLVPALVIALIAMVVLTGMPWLLFILFWVWAFGGFGHHRGRQRNRHSYSYRGCGQQAG
ncbi:MAG TPA: DUF1707 domain-containing protein [Jiangellaceae bacterium]|nr:DUF1707 domain-containing protein [Jiangellaceae bacterium]